MKFFLDLRSCYRPDAGAAPASSRREEAQATLSYGGISFAGRRHRSSGRRPRTDVGGQWRPALSVITEDGDVVRAAAEVKTQERGAKSVNRPTPPKGRSVAKGAQSFSEREDYRPNPLSMFMPAFSPTPFMI